MIPRSITNDLAAAAVIAAARSVAEPVALLPAVGSSAVTGPGASDDAGVAWRDRAIRAVLDEAVRAGEGERILALATSYDSLVSLRLHEGPRGIRLMSAADGERRRRGSFATPEVLANELARRAVTVDARSVIDPACGAGALLRAALLRLIELGIPGPVALQRLHGVDTDPMAVALCQASLAVLAGVNPGDPAAPQAHIVVGDALGDAVWVEHFATELNRAGEPVEPATGWRGGFDAVVANPPWERLKVFRSEGSQTLTRLRGARAEAARSLREDGRHPLTGAGELNTYLPFIETCWRLTAPTGRASILVPAGVSADRSAAPLMAGLLRAGALESLHLMAAGKGLFPGVSARVGVAVVTLRSGSARETQEGGGVRQVGVKPVLTAEVCIDVEDAGDVDPARRWHLDADFATLVNPNTRTIPPCASAQDAELLGRAHRRWPVLVRHDASGKNSENPWQMRLLTPFHMTRDAKWFHDRPGPGRMPLWEAKHAGLLDHHGGSSTGARYWVDDDVVWARFGELAPRGWLGAYRNVTTTDSPRTLMPTALPYTAVGNSLPLIDAPRLPLLLTLMGALPIDHLVRQKHSGANLNFFKLEQLALPSPEQLDQPQPWTGGMPLSQWLLIRFAATQRWDDDLAPLRGELSGLGIDVEAACEELERPDALAEIDASVALLLDYTEQELTSVLDSFSALRRAQQREFGEFRTARRVREAFTRLSGA